MKRHLVTIGFLVLAVACYTVGAAGPATALIILGILAEGVFWLRLIGARRRR